MTFPYQDSAGSTHNFAEVTDESAEKLPVQAGGPFFRKIASFSRPANTTAYSGFNVVADNTVAASVNPMQFSLAPGRSAAVMGGTVFRIDQNAISGSGWAVRLILFNTKPNLVNGDGGAYQLANGQVLSNITLGWLDGTNIAPAYGGPNHADAWVNVVAPTGRSLIGFIVPPSGIVWGLLQLMTTGSGIWAPVSAQVIGASIEGQYL